MTPQLTEQLVNLAIQQAPAIIEMLRGLFHRQTPGLESGPSDEEIIAAYRAAFTSSLAVDEAWLAAHPEDA